MSRRPPDETSFGSDSFLDVIANIVGILIILIVVAGVRVKQAPLLALKVEQAEEVKSEPLVVELLVTDPVEGELPIDAEFYDDASLPVEVEVVNEEPDVPDFVPPPVLTFSEIKAVVDPAELIARANQLRNDTVTKTDELGNLSALLSQLKQSKREESQSVNKLKETLLAAEKKLDQKKLRIESLNLDNQKTQQIVDVLQERLQTTNEHQPEADKLAHRLNPVGRIVSGKEVHFRLVGNRVSYVPVQQLSQLVKRDMQRRRDYLLKQPRFQSTVGPVNGYEMEYLVQRESSSLLSGARLGTGMVRVAVTDWVIRPTDEVISESLEEAIRSRSQFRAALISEGTNATITFWVYPESFGLHRSLKEMVHNAGFWVASRPLPTGFPIAGSASNGSKSVAQ